MNEIENEAAFYASRQLIRNAQRAFERSRTKKSLAALEALYAKHDILAAACRADYDRAERAELVARRLALFGFRRRAAPRTSCAPI